MKKFRDALTPNAEGRELWLAGLDKSELVSEPMLQHNNKFAAAAKLLIIWGVKRRRNFNVGMATQGLFRMHDSQPCTVTRGLLASQIKKEL